MKKILCVLLSVLMIASLVITVNAADISRIDEYNAKFTDGEGPETNGLTIDYCAYEPENKTDGVKYPLVIYIHGMGDGKEQRAQLTKSNIGLWAGEELQSRFKGTDGAYILLPRSHEENYEYWTEDYITALKATIDSYIAMHAGSIDLSRIYIGGYSMGGKMTLKMIISYPTFFAAAFPMCPAYIPTDAEMEVIKDIPIWLIVSKYDVIAGWYTNSQEVWEKITATTNVASDCRLSLMTRVKYPDGTNTLSNHHVWFAVANDLFTYDEGDYYNMTTVDGNGKVVALTSPDGVISWVSSFTSDYAGETVTSTDLTLDNDSISLKYVGRMIRCIWKIFVDVLTDGIAC